VLHCPTTVGGHAPGLAAAERAIGLASVSVALAPAQYTRPADETVARADGSAAVRELTRLRLLLRALRHFDVVHFNYGSSLTPRLYPAAVTGRRGGAHRIFDAYARLVELRDLPLLRRAGKAIFVTYLGDDARQADVARARFAVTQFSEPGLPHDDPDLDRRKRAWIAAFDRYAHGIYAVNPDLLHVLPERARFVPYASVDVRALRPEQPPHTARRLVVAHAPTDRRTKGTRFVLDAVERLRAEGAHFEFRLLEGLPHEEAQRRYADVDLFVDQLLVGWYGVAAVEFMALGTPVVAYLREEDLAFLPSAMRAQLPILSATPETVYGVLREWLTARAGELAHRGEESRRYARRWHDPLEIAGAMRRDYERALGR